MPGRDAVASSRDDLLRSIGDHPQGADARWSQFRQNVINARSAAQVAALDTPALGPGGVRARVGALAGVKTGLFATQERNRIDRALRAYKTAVADRELQRSHQQRVRTAATLADAAAQRKRDEDEGIRRAQEAYAASAEGKAAAKRVEDIRRAVDANQERRRRTAAAEGARRKASAVRDRFNMSGAQWEDLTNDEQARLIQQYDAEQEKESDKKQGMTGIMGNIGGRRTRRKRRKPRHGKVLRRVFRELGMTGKSKKHKKTNRKTRRGKKHQKKRTRRRR